MDSRLLTGAVDMLIMDVLDRGDNYGYQIAQIVLNSSHGCFELKEGSLYPALHRLERAKCLRSYWVNTDEGRRRKYYKLTARGRSALQKRREQWFEFTASVNGVLNTRRGAAHVLA